MMTGETSPTVESLTALFRSGEPIPPLVLLKAGDKGPPIFMTHGIGDTVLGLFRLASQVRSEQPVYGLQAKGCDGIEEPLDRIEDMAEFHLGAIRQAQPHGPYILIGYSFGGDRTGNGATSVLRWREDRSSGDVGFVPRSAANLPRSASTPTLSAGDDTGQLVQTTPRGQRYISERRVGSSCVSAGERQPISSIEKLSPTVL